MEPGCYVVAAATGLALDVKGGSLAAGANVQLYAKNGTGAQKWDVSQGADGYYTLANAASKKALDIANGSTAEGANVQQYDVNNTAAQKWRLVPTGDGWFYLQAKNGSYLTAAGAGDKNGANVFASTAYAASKAQKFGFTATTYTPPITIHRDIRSGLDHGAKPAQYQKYIVLHDTEGTGSPQSVINWWDGNGAGVAAHFVVGRDGQIWQCVEMDRIAHHAGYGNIGHNAEFGIWEDGRDDMRGTVPIGSYCPDYGMNAWSIGIEMVHVGGSGGYPAAQLEALDKLIRYIDAYYGFESAITDHKAWRHGNSDTSPEFATYLWNYQHYRHH
jgi:hypothetical protein